MKGPFTRRDVLELGVGSAILGACSRTAIAGGTGSVFNKQEGNRMPTLEEFNSYGEELERELILRSAPIAVKMLKTEADIPAGALRPKKDKNKHYAQCQVFSLSRRDRLTVAMLKDDNWCLGPLLAYGLVETPSARSSSSSMQYKRFEYGKYIGILTAPLKSAAFEPDNEYWINLPDPGEYVRALTQPGEMMFSIPIAKLSGFMEGLRKFYKESMFAREQMMMEADFSQPDVYRKMFESWGMEHS
jgi:uncharacterized protein (DUF169 family)